MSEAGGIVVVLLLLIRLFSSGGTDTKEPKKIADKQSQRVIDRLKQKLAVAERAARVASDNTPARKAGAPLQTATKSLYEHESTLPIQPRSTSSPQPVPKPAIRILAGHAGVKVLYD